MTPKYRVAGWNRLSVLGAALAAAGSLTGVPAAAYLTDATETANDAAITAMVAVPGTIYDGCVGDLFQDGTTEGCVHNSDGSTLGDDPADFLRWAGLAVGTPYQFTITEFFITGGVINLGIFSDAAGTISAPLSGNVPNSGLLLFRATPDTFDNSAEGYTVRLNAQLASVPEPATVALLAAGLAGAFVARRRKRN